MKRWRRQEKRSPLPNASATIEVSTDGERAHGRVRILGELWNARCDPALAPTLQPGDEVDLTYNDDLSVTVLGKRHAPPNA